MAPLTPPTVSATMADPKKKEQSNIKNFSDHHSTVMETLRRRPVPSSSIQSRGIKNGINDSRRNIASSIQSRGKNGINDSQRKIAHLVEHHFNFDKNHNLLPGLPKHDQDLARDIHDFFNLIILVSKIFKIHSLQYEIDIVICSYILFHIS